MHMIARVMLGVTCWLIIGGASVGGAIQVVSSLPTLSHFAHVIGGDRVSVVSLSSGREDPHSLMVKPSMVVKVRQADLILLVGMDLDPWMTELVKLAGKQSVQVGQVGYLDFSTTSIRRLGVMSPADLMKLKGYEHSHPQGNPHYWLSIQNAKIMADRLTEVLSQLDPDSRASFRLRNQAFQKELTLLQATIQATATPLKGKRLLVIHDAWGYLLDNVGLSIHANLEEAPGVSPGPVHLSGILSQIKAKKLDVLLVDQHGGSRYDSYINMVKKAGCPVAKLSQSTTPQTPTYVALIQRNIQAMVDAVR